MPAGRFAPSPTGPLHLGNLRTALVAWLFARSDDAPFMLRIDDLDVVASRTRWVDEHQRDLAALGLDWDGPVVRQSERRAEHLAAVARLEATGRTYPCFCSRREILEAAAAPHGAGVEGAYPGTCRDLSVDEQAARAAVGRPPALRLRADGAVVEFTDRLHGAQSGPVDDFVLRRGDGTPAYNLAVVVDDAAQAIGEVVRGDDLLESTPRQVLLAQLLDLPVPVYAHVPLVLGPDGERLAKRHGSVTLADRAAASGRSLVDEADAARDQLAASLGLVEVGEHVSPATLVDRFDGDRLPTTPWRLPS